MSVKGFKAVLQIPERATWWIPLTEQQWGKEEGCMRNRMKKSTSILYNCNAMVDGGKLPWAAVCASVFLSVKSVDIQRWVRT